MWESTQALSSREAKTLEEAPWGTYELQESSFQRTSNKCSPTTDLVIAKPYMMQAREGSRIYQQVSLLRPKMGRKAHKDQTRGRGPATDTSTQTQGMGRLFLKQELPIG